MEYKHIPVLLEETINSLNIKPNGIYVDMTLGRGGHSSRILTKLQNGHLYCFDQDPEAIKESYQRLKEISDNFTLINTNFKNLTQELNKVGVEKVDGILFDLGVSSAQFDEGDRGFSYRFDAKLDMRMNPNDSLSAYTIVNTYSLNDLTRVIKDYGEEKFAYQIAKNIVKQREVKPIETTFELVDIIKKSKPEKELRKIGHPAKQTFQALRIEVNHELDVLKDAIQQALNMLNPSGRIAVITFNSLEDRIVKEIFKDKTTPKFTSRYLPQIDEHIEFELVNRKVIVATEEELLNNNRAKSAKLRVIERKKSL